MKIRSTVTVALLLTLALSLSACASQPCYGIDRDGFRAEVDRLKRGGVNLVIKAPGLGQERVVGSYTYKYKPVAAFYAWRDAQPRYSVFDQAYSVYCNTFDEVGTCMGYVVFPNAKFRLRLIHITPEPGTPQHAELVKIAKTDFDAYHKNSSLYFCSPVEVGIDYKGTGWSGGRELAQRWIKLKADKQGASCEYRIPRSALDKPSNKPKSSSTLDRSS